MTARKGRQSDLIFGVFLAMMFVAVLILAKTNYGTFPLANEDDASFYIPAWNLTVFGDLKPAALNAPDGIYWVPHGFYLWIAVFLRLIGTHEGVAIAAGATSVAAEVVLLLSGLARVAKSRSFAAACAILLVSPAAIFAANSIRMESLIVLLFAASVWLHTRGRFAAAMGLLSLSLLVHPALSFSIALYLFVLIILAVSHQSGSGRPRTGYVVAGNLIVVAIVALAYIAEARLIAAHWQLFRAQMMFQAQRKQGRTIADILLHRRGLLLIAETFIIGALGVAASSAAVGRRFLREIAPVGLMALGLQAYAAIGFEMPYAVYSYSVVPATILCVAYGTTGLIQSRSNSAAAADCLEE